MLCAPPRLPRVSDGHQPAPFVVGVGRSGTTLLRLMLDAHPELSIPPETHFLPALIKLYAGSREPNTDELVEAVETHPGWRDFGMDENELRIAFAGRAGFGSAGDAAGAIRSFYAAYASAHEKPRWGDKTPVYIESIAQIGEALGDQARFVHLIRDGRDVAVSRGARAVKRGREATPARDEAETWKRRIEGARAEGNEVAHYLELRYEDLIADPETALRTVCEFIDLPYDPAMLEYHERSADRLQEIARDLDDEDGGALRPAAERIEAHSLVTEAPRSDRVDRWRKLMPAEDIAEFEAIAGDLLAELGYEVTTSEGREAAAASQSESESSSD